jgi:hypothetical protein
MVVEEGALEAFNRATAKKLHIFWPPIRAFPKQLLLVLWGQKRIELESEMLFLLKRSTDRASVKLNRQPVSTFTPINMTLPFMI